MTNLTSLPIYLHISSNRDFLLSCGLWQKALVSWVELPVHVLKFDQATNWQLGQPITSNVPLEMGDGMNVDLIHFNLSLLSYSLEFTYSFTDPYLVSFNFFDPWWRRKSKINYSFQFVPRFFFVSIDRDNFLLCAIKHRTSLTNYFPVLTFYLSHTETELSLLLVFKGCFLLLIVCIINTSFHIHFLFFIYWKHNITFIWPTCWG